MTTSPTPIQEERKEAPNAQQDKATAATATTLSKAEQALTEERVSNIGWYFIKSYYDFYISKLDVIYKIYQENASILHDAFPVGDDNDEDDELTTSYKARGTDAIKKCFAEHLSGGGNDTNRIVITSASFQVSLEKNIIIVTFGEWSKNDSPFKQFTQTFVLTPGKRESTYDVANDILKFIESNGFKDNKSTTQEDVKEGGNVDVDEKTAAKVDGGVPVVETQEQPASEAINTTEKTAEREVKKEEQEVEAMKEAEPGVQENVEEKSEDAPKSESSEKEPQQQQPKEEKKEKKPEEPAKPKSPPQPLTWADLAYQAVPASKPTSKPTTSTSTTASTPISTKKNPAATPQQQQQQSTGAGGSGKFKKDEWYPIYIRGIRSIDEKVLRDHLTKKFGELKFFRTNQNIALCDFVLKEAQRKALDAKETTLDGVVINLEPRESKTGNNFHNSNNGYNKKKFGGDKDGKDKFGDKKGINGNTNGSGGGSSGGGKFSDGKKVATNANAGATKQKLGKLNATK
ncbi:hypothetical protein CANMA_003857 [Candida margitis]|uniref:uncharacterized protein n=1 Tax=Candida margitis TaxID=1775924 RepID=UPI00222724E1|nr:uncharacterized protein CANMA_003857 [Candida margitis]KAI5961083.1 hypothetical protein CANMA_003857 [Candida margitis]